MCWVGDFVGLNMCFGLIFHWHGDLIGLERDLVGLGWAKLVVWLGYMEIMLCRILGWVGHLVLLEIWLGCTGLEL